MIRIDIEDVRQIEDEIDRLNKLDLNDVELYIADERVFISKQMVKDWKFIGLNNYHFFKDEFYLDSKVIEDGQAKCSVCREKGIHQPWCSAGQGFVK